MAQVWWEIISLRAGTVLFSFVFLAPSTERGSQ